MLLKSTLFVLLDQTRIDFLRCNLTETREKRQGMPPSYVEETADLSVIEENVVRSNNW